MAKHSNLRMTHQRRIILEELRNFTNHPSADEVYDQVRKRLPKISLGTVYRNLEVLTELGLIYRISSDGPPMRYDGNTSHHYHIKCVVCGLMEDVERQDISLFQTPLEEFAGYQILGHRFELMGVCPSCRNQSK